jgi:hypothetical protein
MKLWPLDWNAYPVAPGACPTRPWWRCGGPAHPLIGWTRNDGALFYIDPGRSTAQALAPNGMILFDVPPSLFKPLPFDPEPFLADLDAACPVMAPPPRCGQVWLDVDRGRERLVIDVLVLFPELLWCVTLGSDSPRNYERWAPENAVNATWPPASMLLIAGPFSPWSF